MVLATFSVTFAVSQGADRQGVLYAYAAASLISIMFVILGGRLSDKLGRRPVMIGGLVLFIIYLVPMFQLLSSNNIVLIFVAFAIGLMIHSIALRTSGGVRVRAVRHHLPLHRRVPGLPAGDAARRRLHPGHRGPDLQGLRPGHGSVVWYLAIMSLVSIIFILLTREPKNNDLQTVQALTLYRAPSNGLTSH